MSYKTKFDSNRCCLGVVRSFLPQAVQTSKQTTMAGNLDRRYATASRGSFNLRKIFNTRCFYFQHCNHCLTAIGSIGRTDSQDFILEPPSTNRGSLHLHYMVQRARAKPVLESLVGTVTGLLYRGANGPSANTYSDTRNTRMYLSLAATMQSTNAR
ncbi:hypothetical protein BDV96DRAFT_90010 [Lophiotrema nucula]|uniref:Uncharacterized protein n=1 Tax=Lophiotrema nucula TaxID=690887 RepID=A0A6A5Z6B5_9PLEO|nr:hypothetical protein BDV96DRAFT_90010 [Lophiotrema nucula]